MPDTLFELLGPIEQQLVEESHSRTVAAAAQAIRASIGNLPFPTEDVEVFISASSERLGALLRHDMVMWMHQNATSVSANPGPAQNPTERCTAWVKYPGVRELNLCNIQRDRHYSMNHNFRGKSGW